MTLPRPGGPLYFLLLCNHTAFFKLDSVFPECYLYRDQMPRTDPLMCLHSTCPANHSCMETVAKRLFVLFNEVMPQVELIILYFRKQTTLGLGAGLFWKNMQEPRFITMNPSAWDLVKSRGFVFEFQPGASFFLSGAASTPELKSDSEKVVLEPTSRRV